MPSNHRGPRSRAFSPPPRGLRNRHGSAAREAGRREPVPAAGVGEYGAGGAHGASDPGLQRAAQGAAHLLRWVGGASVCGSGTVGVGGGCGDPHVCLGQAGGEGPLCKDVHPRGLKRNTEDHQRCLASQGAAWRQPCASEPGSGLWEDAPDQPGREGGAPRGTPETGSRSRCETGDQRWALEKGEFGVLRPLNWSSFGCELCPPGWEARESPKASVPFSRRGLPLPCSRSRPSRHSQAALPEAVPAGVHQPQWPPSPGPEASATQERRLIF